MQDRREGYQTVATKISNMAYERLNKIARKKGLTIYELIQMVCDTLIRYMDDRHNLSEEMERAMSIFEHLTGWADALNLADPTVHK
jgi:predicted DNA-binding ribbon-helix-helix protein